MVACVFTSVRKKEIRQFSTMTEDILQLVSWLKETDCEMAAMESTGSYWKPVYNIFEEEQIPIMVVNAQQMCIRDRFWTISRFSTEAPEPAVLPPLWQRNTLMNSRIRSDRIR